jgi:hypothetical protein
MAGLPRMLDAQIVQTDHREHKGFDVVTNGATYAVLWSHFITLILSQGGTVLEIRSSTHRFILAGRKLGVLYNLLMENDSVSRISISEPLQGFMDHPGCVIETISPQELP